MEGMMQPWNGERIVETKALGRLFRVTLRPNGKHKVVRVIFGITDNHVSRSDKAAAIAAALKCGS
jgi:hypothetical protein